MFISMLRRRRLDIESLNSDTMTSRPSLMNSGKRVAVYTDHRKKIGSVPQNNCDPALKTVSKEKRKKQMKPSTKD